MESMKSNYKKKKGIKKKKASELESDLWDRKWLVDFSAGKIQLVSFEQPNNTGTINDLKMDGSALEEKSSLKILGLPFSSKLNCWSYFVHIAKTASKKIGALIGSMKFLSPEVALYLYKSTIRPCMEYCCYIDYMLLGNVRYATKTDM